MENDDMKAENQTAQNQEDLKEKTSQENCEQDKTSNTQETDCASCKGEDSSCNAKEEQNLKTPEEKIAELEAQIAQLKQDSLYKAAENDNWRKRMMAQKEEAVAYANASLLGDLLESLDNFDRTIEAAKDVKEAASIVDGVKMINKSLVSMLENKYNLVAFGKDGEDFNPDIHEAIGMQEGDVKKEKIQQVYLKGYKLKDRIIRHAKVMVVKPKA
ncbi:nucleotide exchange factor GrpE [Treponema pectinovorum]|uniref:nucleotide exchange factor GrpE n=1 Tax=Treponema pectinovorum TaxID=164 RepID=UPI0021C44E3C|nr:nucleotide exchange factor GrpE [Treponema pectinovorum]